MLRISSIDLAFHARTQDPRARLLTQLIAIAGHNRHTQTVNGWARTQKLLPPRLSQFYAVLASRFAIRPLHFVLRLYLLSGGTTVVIVVHLTMAGRIFRRGGVIRGYFRHFYNSLASADSSKDSMLRNLGSVEIGAATCRPTATLSVQYGCLGSIDTRVTRKSLIWYWDAGKSP